MHTQRFALRRRFVRALGLLLPAGLCLGIRKVSAASPLLLVTPDEARKYAEPGVESMRALPRATPEAPAGPRIDLLRPLLEADLNLKSPFPIEVRFVPLADAAIDPASFRVLYGNLRLDVTSRILDRVKVAATGFSVPEAAIPAGRHRLLLRVNDVRQRTGELDLRFDVA